jgi:hypothetical protein
MPYNAPYKINQRRQKLKKLGLCVTCGSNPIFKHYTRCESCYVKHKEGNDGRGQNRIKNGLCRYCGKPRERVEIQACNNCNEKAKAKQLEKWKIGVCRQCGKSRERRNVSLCNECSEQATQRSLIYSRNLRYLAIDHYTSGLMRCSNCGWSIFEALEFDHINGNGENHRKTNLGARSIARWLIQNEFPNDVQVICGNCHNFKTRNGRLPDVTELKDAINTQLDFLEV